MKRSLFIFLILICATALYAFSQFAKKESISAVLLHEVNLESPPPNIFAVSILDQGLKGDKNIPKGTRFIGTLTKDDNSTIYFNILQMPNGKKEQFFAKAILSRSEQPLTPTSRSNIPGVSAKISKTLYKQTRTNVLGAIFKDQKDISSRQAGYILPKGTIIEIETN